MLLLLPLLLLLPPRILLLLPQLLQQLLLTFLFRTLYLNGPLAHFKKAPYDWISQRCPFTGDKEALRSKCWRRLKSTEYEINRREWGRGLGPDGADGASGAGQHLGSVPRFGNSEPHCFRIQLTPAMHAHKKHSLSIFPPGSFFRTPAHAPAGAPY